MIKQLLSQIGWYGLDRLLVLEMDLNGKVHQVALMGRKRNRVALLRFWPEGTNWQEILQQNELPFAIALRLENPFEKAVSLTVDNPLQAAMGIGLEQNEPFLYQCIQSGEHQFVCISRKDHLKLLLAQIDNFRDRWVYLNLSQRVKYGLGEETEGEDEYIAEQLELPTQALYAFAAGVNFYRTEGQDLLGMETELAAVSQFHQRGKWIRKMGYTALTLVLILGLLVLGNLFLNRQNAQYQAFAQTQSPILHQLTQLQEQFVNRKNQLFRLQQQLQVSRLSYWLDRSLQDCPKDLILRNWQFPPDPQKLSAINPENQEFHLLLEGSTQRPESISLLRKHLLALPGIAKIHVVPAPYQFQQDRYPFAVLVRFQDGYATP